MKLETLIHKYLVYCEMQKGLDAINDEKHEFILRVKTKSYPSTRKR